MTTANPGMDADVFEQFIEQLHRYVRERLIPAERAVIEADGALGALLPQLLPTVVALVGGAVAVAVLRPGDTARIGRQTARGIGAIDGRAGGVEGQHLGPPAAQPAHPPPTTATAPVAWKRAATRLASASRSIASAASRPLRATATTVSSGTKREAKRRSG